LFLSQIIIRMEMHRDKMAVHAQKVVRRGAIDHSLSSFKNIKDLQSSGILGTFFFDSLIKSIFRF